MNNSERLSFDEVRGQIDTSGIVPENTDPLLSSEEFVGYDEDGNITQKFNSFYTFFSDLEDNCMSLWSQYYNDGFLLKYLELDYNHAGSLMGDELVNYIQDRSHQYLGLLQARKKLDAERGELCDRLKESYQKTLVLFREGACWEDLPKDLRESFFKDLYEAYIFMRQFVSRDIHLFA